MAKARTLGTQADRARLYAEIQETVARDISVVPIAHSKIQFLMLKRAEGLVPGPNGNVYMETASLR